MKKILLTLLTTASFASADQMLLPDSTETPRMKGWREMKYGMFLCFGMNTFTGIELDPGDQPSTTYAPQAVDTDQWMRVARDAGMKYAVLTAKHTGGHCLWDSKVQFRGKEYDYDVATSGNKTDVIRSFLDSCEKHNIVPGLYYSLFDFRNNSVEHKLQWTAGLLADDYFQLAKDQLAELATRYPEARYYWLDIPRAASPAQRATFYDLLRRLNPKCVVLHNQGFIKPKKTPTLTVQNTDAASWPSDILNSERTVLPEPFVNLQTWQGKTHFLCYEHCDVIGKRWFWHAGDKARSIDTLYQLYDGATKAGGNLLLSAGPDRCGRLPDWQIDALMKLKEKIDSQP